MWIWTEPHSMRLKVRLTVRAEVGESPRSVEVQQRLPVELHVQWSQCPDCNREYTNRTWQALVQLRQKRQDESKKALLMLEAAIARHKDIRKHVLSLETTRNGFDFYFLKLMDAHSFSSFLSTIYPLKVHKNQKLVSEDSKNNSANIKHTIVCDMVPLNRYDLIICDKRAAKEGCSAGRLNGRMCLVNKVSSSLQLVDAAPARTEIQNCFTHVPQEKYWKGEKYFRIVFSMNRLVRFVVMDIELCDDYSGYHGRDNEGEQEHGHNKFALADVIVARESDIGVTDESFHCTTHLGNLLNIGDHVLGYDLVSSVLPGGDEWSMNNSFNSSFNMPDVVLVKKVKVKSVEEEAAHTEEKKKAKSSGSKKRERRQRKQEKNMKKKADALRRMGFDGGDEDNHDSLWDEERKAFEEELNSDAELAAELKSIIGHKIKMSKEVISEEAANTDENDSPTNTLTL